MSRPDAHEDGAPPRVVDGVHTAPARQHPTGLNRPLSRRAALTGGATAAALLADAILPGQPSTAQALPLPPNNAPPNTNTLYPEDFGAKGDGMTDDTDAFQACIDAVPPAGATIRLGPKTYLLIRAPRRDRQGNSILSLTFGGFDFRPVRFQGVASRSSGSGNGTVLKTTRTGDTYSSQYGPPSMIGAATAEQQGGMPVLFCGPVTFEDVTITAPANPSIAGVDGIAFGGLIRRRAKVASADGGNTICTNAHAFGFRDPWIYDFGLKRCEDTNVTGFYVGFLVTHIGALRFDNAYAYKCVIGLAFQDRPSNDWPHGGLKGRMLIEQSANLITGWDPSTGKKSPTFGNQTIQELWVAFEAGAGPYALVDAVLDANNKLHGELILEQNTGTYELSTFPITGGANLNARLARRSFSRRAGRPDASWPAGSNQAYGAYCTAVPSSGGFGFAAAFAAINNKTDTGPRWQVYGGSGEMQFGSGTGAPDCNLKRASADVVMTNDRFKAADGITTKTKTGAPSDADFLHTPEDGTIVVDTTNSRIYVRVGGAWKSANLT